MRLDCVAGSGPMAQPRDDQSGEKRVVGLRGGLWAQGPTAKRPEMRRYGAPRRRNLDLLP